MLLGIPGDLYLTHHTGTVPADLNRWPLEQAIEALNPVEHFNCPAQWYFKKL
jgi:hypothetical protein